MEAYNQKFSVTNNDRLTGSFIGCDIVCDFNIFKDNYVRPKMFELRDFFADKSEDFKLVFQGATSLYACELKGNDTPLKTIKE